MYPGPSSSPETQGDPPYPIPTLPRDSPKETRGRRSDTLKGRRHGTRETVGQGSPTGDVVTSTDGTTGEISPVHTGSPVREVVTLDRFSSLVETTPITPERTEGGTPDPREGVGTGDDPGVRTKRSSVPDISPFPPVGGRWIGKGPSLS